MMAVEPLDPGNSLPANIEAEAALLGAMMIENRVIDRVADILIPEHFFEPLHGRIFSAIMREHSLGRLANPVTLRPYFVDDQAMKEVGGASYMMQLTGSGAAIIGAYDFATQVVELARRRMLIEKLEEIVANARSADGFEKSYSEMVAEAESAIAEAGREAAEGSREISASDAIDKAVRAGEDSKRRGSLSGIDALDDVLGPIRRKDLAILAGRPGMGKSALASSYSLGAAANGHGVLFVSLEMSAEQLGARMAADLSFDGRGKPVPYGLIESGQMKREEIRRVYEAKERIETLPVQIVDIGQCTTGRLNSLTRRWKRRMAARGVDLDLVVVDYLQKMRPNHRTRDRIEAVAEISQDLKTIAKDNDVGVLALSQLSRAVESRADHRPQLSDLRESGQIEQDADAVLFVYRQEYYLEQSEPKPEQEGRAKWEAAMEACRGDIEFICAKRRQGRTGTKRGKFHGAFGAVRG